MTSEHKPLARWMWSSGLLAGHAVTCAMLQMWWVMTAFIACSVFLAGFYWLEGSYGK